VLAGDDGRALAFGPGWAAASAAPGSGHGATIISGHRDTHFAWLRHLQPGDEVELETTAGLRRYRLASTRIADARETRLDPNTPDHRLILVTCWPFDATTPRGPLRYVLSFEAVEGEVLAASIRVKESLPTSGSDLRPHAGDDGGVVGGAKDGGAGDEGVGAGGGDFADVLRLHAAVDLQADRLAQAVDAFAHLAQLVQGRGNEGLTAEARVHRHQQHQVQVFQHPVQHFHRRGRVQHQAGLATLRPDQLDGPVHMLAGLRVKADQRGAGLGEVRHDP